MLIAATQIIQERAILLRCGQVFLRYARCIPGENRMSRVGCDSRRSASASRTGVRVTLVVSSSVVGFLLPLPDFKTCPSFPELFAAQSVVRAGIAKFPLRWGSGHLGTGGTMIPKPGRT